MISAIRSAGLVATYGESEEGEAGSDEPDYLPEGQRQGQPRKQWGWGSVISMGAKKQEPQPPEQGQWGWNSVVKAIWG